MLNEAIVTIARETGWTLEYIRSLPVDYLQVILNEITFQKTSESYQATYNAAMIVCALINSEDKHYTPEEIIGERPERRIMAEVNIAQPPKFDSLVLADGKEYQLAPLTVNIMADLEDKFDKPIDELFSGSVRMKVLRALLFARIKNSCPDMTEEQLGDLITDDVLINMKNKLGV
jgi:hypothetical protein